MGMSLMRRFLDALGLRRKGKMTLSAVVHRADGSSEDLGVIAEGTIEITPSMEG